MRAENLWPAVGVRASLTSRTKDAGLGIVLFVGDLAGWLAWRRLRGLQYLSATLFVCRVPVSQHLTG